MKLIIRKDKVFTHIGIYLNNSQIVHFSSETNNFFKNDKILKVDSLLDFSRHRLIKLIDSEIEISDDDILKIFMDFKGVNKNYNLTKNCCYTFVMWCLYRKEKTGLKDILLFSVHYKFPIFALLLFW
jgi:hypothetical protein